MCHGSKAKPPRPPIVGGAGTVREGDLMLVAEDGTLFGTYGARSDHHGGAGVVILPDVRGLHPFYRDLAVRFAEVGFHACAIDYFGRTAEIGPRDDDFDVAPHIQRTQDATIALDVRAAIAHLRSGAGGASSAVFTVGFCFGGRNSFNQAARGHHLDGVIGFYGRVARHPGDDEDTPIELVNDFKCPILGLFGGADQSIPLDDITAFRLALDHAGVGNDIVVYEGATHSFFDRSSERFRQVCEDAWHRVLSFIEANS
jgi:carboxymethylenebutenolidase